MVTDYNKTSFPHHYWSLIDLPSLKIYAIDKEMGAKCFFSQFNPSIFKPLNV